ncbi:hypothetical protein [Aeromicrobium fastidiosum]|uniref:hypothetical protein n=1 Tax=Aeromicrobium fastidiosum TaxID=52699 RepID=UPI0010E211C4
MVDAVDLEHQPVSLPHDVEVVPAVRALPNDLAVGLWQAAATADACDVELSEGLGTAHQVEHDPLEEATALVPADVEQRHRDLLGRGQPLLDRHGQEQRRLPV